MPLENIVSLNLGKRQDMFAVSKANNFLNDLSQMPWENVALYDNPNVCWRVWRSLFLHILDWHAPPRLMRLRGNSIPWISPGIKNLMRVRDSYKKMAVKNNSQIYSEKFKEIRNKVNSALTKAKTAFFCNKFENCAQSKDMKHSWKLINILSGKNKKSNNISQLKRDDVVISDDTLKAEAFNDFFVNIGVNLANEIENDSPCTNFSDDENYHSNYYSNINFKFSEISMDDII